jgi:hypothetical protein
MGDSLSERIGRFLSKITRSFDLSYWTDGGFDNILLGGLLLDIISSTLTPIIPLSPSLASSILILLSF